MKWLSRKLITWAITSTTVVSLAVVGLYTNKIDQGVFERLLMAFMGFTISYFVANVWNKKVTNGNNNSGKDE